MNYRAALTKCREGLKKGTFKMVRLVKVGNPDPLTPFSKINKPEEALSRLDYIETIIREGLEPGRYQLQCKISHSRNSKSHNYEFIIPEKYLPAPGSPDIADPNEPTLMNEFCDAEEYKALIKRVATLEANEKIYQMEITFWKMKAEELMKNPAATPMNDAPKDTSWTEAIGKALSDIAPAVTGILTEHYAVQNRKLDLEEKKLSSNPKPKSLPMGKKSKAPFEDVLARKVSRLEKLEQADPDAFNEELDRLQEEDPEMYAAVCEELDIEDYEEEEEEVEEEEDEEDGEEDDNA